MIGHEGYGKGTGKSNIWREQPGKIIDHGY
jgi:hypothetical protein